MTFDQRRWPMLVAAAGWSALLAWTFVGSGDYPECTASAPCGADWAGAGLIVLWVSTIVLLVWTPALARGAVAVLASLALLLAHREYPYVSTPVLVLGVLSCTAVSYAAVAARAAGVRRGHQRPPVVPPSRQAPWPGPSPRSFWRPGTIAGAGLVMAGLVLLGLAIGWGQHHARIEAAAPRVEARVLAHESNDDTDRVLVGLAADRRERIVTESLSSYPVGSTTTVLLLPDHHVRLAAEPYDASAWGAGAFALLALGGTLLYRGRAANNRLTRVFNSPVLPVSDLAAVPYGVQMLLYRSGDRADAAVPIGALSVRRYQGPTDSAEDSLVDQWTDGTPWPAQVYGLLADGETIGAVVETPNGPAYLGGTFRLPSGGASAPLGIETEDASYSTEDLDVSSADLPITWRPTRGRQLLAWARVAGGVVGLVSMQALHLYDGLPELLWNLAIWLGLIVSGLTGLRAGLRATASGLTVTTALRTRDLPWRTLRGASSTTDGVVLRREGAADLLLPRALTTDRARPRQPDITRAALARTLDTLIDRMSR